MMSTKICNNTYHTFPCSQDSLHVKMDHPYRISTTRLCEIPEIQSSCIESKPIAKNPTNYKAQEGKWITVADKKNFSLLKQSRTGILLQTIAGETKSYLTRNKYHLPEEDDGEEKEKEEESKMNVGEMRMPDTITNKTKTASSCPLLEKLPSTLLADHVLSFLNPKERTILRSCSKTTQSINDYVLFEI